MAMTCGYCGGSGRVANHQADRYGPRPDYPAERPCEYCNGSGQCERGDILLPQAKPSIDEQDDAARNAHLLASGARTMNADRGKH